MAGKRLLFRGGVEGYLCGISRIVGWGLARLTRFDPNASPPCFNIHTQYISVFQYHPSVMASFFDIAARRAAAVTANTNAVPSTEKSKDLTRPVPWVEK